MSKAVLGEGGAGRSRCTAQYTARVQGHQDHYRSVGNGRGQSLWPPLAGLDGPAAPVQGCSGATVCESRGALWLSPAQEEALRPGNPETSPAPCLESGQRSRSASSSSINMRFQVSYS